MLTTPHAVSRPRFQWRVFTSLVVTFGFLTLALTGIGLYVTPPGRVANWSGWSLLGLTKAQWQAVHTVFGLLFIAGAGVHLFFNWRALMSYVKSRTASGLRRRREIAWSLVVASSLFVLAAGDLPPVSEVAALRETIANSWSDPTTEPPVPHAELLTLAKFTEAQKLSLETAVQQLRAAGATADENTTLAEVARQLEATPQEVYGRLGVQKVAAPAVAGGGMGWKTVRAASAELGTPLDIAMARLTAAGIHADPDATLRDLASRHDRHAPELLAVIRGTPQ